MASQSYIKYNNENCAICSKGDTKSNRLITASSKDSIDTIKDRIQERISLGETKYLPLSQYLEAEEDWTCIKYHAVCRKDVTHKEHIIRLQKRSLPIPTASGDASILVPTKRGRPCTNDSKTATIKQINDDINISHTGTTRSKTKICMFHSCDFCEKSSNPLHLVKTTGKGARLISIKNNTMDQSVRLSLCDLDRADDASIIDKYYHKNCFIKAERTCESSEQRDIRACVTDACDEQLLLAVENTLNDDDTLNMADVNDAYLSILRRFHVEINASQNYKKYLKKLISDRLPSVQFVKSVRRNETDTLVLETSVSKAIDMWSTMLDDSETIGYMKHIAKILRDEMAHHRNWVFDGEFDNFENPPMLQFFLSRMLFGSHVHKVSGKRNEEVDKSVDAACQYLIQNTRSDRQVKHQSKGNETFRQTVQTPLSIGLPLSIHARVRDKSIVDNLTNVYIGCDYRNIIHLEKRIEQGILERIMQSGGFCLPDFVKRGVNIWFAIDNIDLIEDTPTGQNTFHGTVVVINQRAVDGEPVNGPLVIPEKLTTTPLAFKINYLQEPTIKQQPIRFRNFELGKRNNFLSSDYTRIWAIANYIGVGSAGEIQPEQQQQGGMAFDDDPPIEVYREIELEHMHGGEHQSNVTVEEENISPRNEIHILSVEKSTKNTKKLAKETIMPTWAATKSLLLSKSSHTQCRTNTEVIAPLFRTPPTDYATLYTALKLTQGISAEVVGPDRKTLITLDLDLYNRGVQIQQSVGNYNWILRPGGLHISFALLHSLGKTIDGSGMDTCAIESGVYTAAALRGIYGGKAYKRGVEYHITNSLAILMMKFDDISESLQPGPLRAHCNALKDALHHRSADMVGLYSNLQSAYRENVKPLEEERDLGELAQFLMQYLEQVESLLQFINACRSGDWEGYLASLENNIKYFFARDLFNYARLMPLHLAEMNALEKDDPVTVNALRSGDFVVAKSDIPFTQLFVDQALEQQIKVLKRYGGMVGLSQDEAALDRLVTITPHLSHLVKQFLNAFPKTSTSDGRKEHYQLSGSIAVRSRENAVLLQQSIEEHCEGNPFSKKTPLKNITSSALIPDSAKSDILNFQERGQARFQEFIDDRLLSFSKLSIWDHMKKMKLKSFSNWMEKTRIRVGDKVVKLREERQLLGRFLIIQKSRPELVPKLEKAIGDFEMSVVPRSLCAVDGSLYIPTDKSSLLHAIEGAQGPATPSDIPPQSQLPKVLIIDAMAVLQTMNKSSTTKKLSDLEEAFIKRIEKMMIGYCEGHVVFDRYIEQSLKNKTRQKRATTCTEYKIHHNMKLTMTIKELLSSSSTKSSLTSMFANALLNHFCSVRDVKLVVVYGTTIKGWNIEEQHSHEEADTLIPHQVIMSIGVDPRREICVWSPDTDVLTLLIDLASRKIGSQTRLKFLTGKAAKHREIDVVERANAIGRAKSQGLVGFHHFTGADWGGKFVGITKKTWVEAYWKLEEDDPVVACFGQLGNSLIRPELVDGDLPSHVKDLEKFVCQVYSSKGEADLATLRWELFRSRNLEGELLPPTRAALLPHIARANYFAMRDKSYVTRLPDLPAIEESGWRIDQGVYAPVLNLVPPAPRAVIELIKCGCKTGCTGRCSCCKNNLPCTPLCKCYGKQCTNMEKDTRENDEDEEED